MSQQIATRIHETDSESQVWQQTDKPFRARVAVGTLVGVMTCLLFAALLMLVFRMSNSPGITETGHGDGSGTGTGDRPGDGTSGDDDAHGDNDQTIEGDVNDSAAVTAGSVGQRSGIEAPAEAPGIENPETEQNDAPATNGTGTVDKKNAPPHRDFVVPPLEQLQPDSSADDGIQDSGAARAPGMFAGRNAEQREELVKSEGGSAASEAAVELGLKWLAEHQEKDNHVVITTLPQAYD